MIFSTFFSYSGVIPRLELEALRIFLFSIKKNYQDAEVVIITDHASAGFFRSEGLRVFAVDVQRHTLLLDRVRSYKKLMETFDQESLFVFMDFDMILLKRFDFLEESFDCAYTLRSAFKQQPINGGLAVYRNNEKGLAILSEVIDRYKALPQEQKRWWGDQISISSLLMENYSSLEPGSLSIRQGEILLLDVSVYNWTPHDFDVSLGTLSKNLFIDRPLVDWVGNGFSSKHVAHFKGPRKHLQYQFWEQGEGGLYLEKIIPIFSTERDKISRLGRSYFTSKPNNIDSYHKFLDLAVLSVLNIFNSENASDDREDVISMIASFGDSRAEVLRSL